MVPGVEVSQLEDLETKERGHVVQSASQVPRHMPWREPSAQNPHAQTLAQMLTSRLQRELANASMSDT